MQPYGLGCESCGTRGRHAAECAAMCRCGVRVVECDRGTMAQHDERIKALADRELKCEARMSALRAGRVMP